MAQRWAEWDSAMGLYMDAINIAAANQRSAFLYSAGKKVWDIVDKMEDVNTLQKVRQKLAAHFEGQMNEVYETFQLLHVRQGAEESMDAFYGRLQAAAKYCNLNVTVQPSGEQAAFTVSFKDRLLRDLIVLQCYSSKLQRRLLDEGSTLTLQRAVELGRNFQQTTRQMKSLDDPSGAVHRGRPGKPVFGFFAIADAR